MSVASLYFDRFCELSVRMKWIERWLENVEDVDVRHRFEQRLAMEDFSEFHPVWFELVVHQILICLGHRVGVEILGDGDEKRPDFLAYSEGGGFRVEATVCLDPAKSVWEDLEEKVRLMFPDASMYFLVDVDGSPEGLFTKDALRRPIQKALDSGSDVSEWVQDSKGGRTLINVNVFESISGSGGYGGGGLGEAEIVRNHPWLGNKLKGKRKQAKGIKTGEPFFVAFNPSLEKTDPYNIDADIKKELDRHSSIDGVLAFRGVASGSEASFGGIFLGGECSARVKLIMKDGAVIPESLEVFQDEQFVRDFLDIIS